VNYSGFGLFSYPAIAAAESLNSAEHLISSKILDSAYDAIISVDRQERIVVFNQGAERMFGYAVEEIMGKPLDSLFLEHLGEAHLRHVGDFAVSEIRARRKDGTEFPAEASMSKVNGNGKTVCTVIIRDATDRVLARETLKRSLREKDALLKTIHHRVKNNLQVVSSLLGLQSRVVAEPKLRKMFQESQDRVHSMALLHESLYQSQSPSRIDFPSYVRQLGTHLFQSYGVSAELIRLRTDLDEIYLNLDAAVPCGLIINELVSNSLKYAFPDGRKGEVRIELRRCSDGTARLVVSDNGVGLKADVDWVDTTSLGLRLVRTLAEQLGARIELRSSAGTEVQLAFAAAA
jgi:PAS domain S-box-containing protein